MKRIISTNKAPQAIGPYSQAVEANGQLFVSGQIPLHPDTGEMPDGIEAQTRQVFENIKAILEEAGYSFADVVKSVVLLKDINDFAVMNKVYAEYYTENPPARAAYEVANLPKNSMVEIETIAIK